MPFDDEEVTHQVESLVSEELLEIDTPESLVAIATAIHQQLGRSKEKQLIQRLLRKYREVQVKLSTLHRAFDHFALAIQALDRAIIVTGHDESLLGLIADLERQYHDTVPRDSGQFSSAVCFDVIGIHATNRGLRVPEKPSSSLVSSNELGRTPFSTPGFAGGWPACNAWRDPLYFLGYCHRLVPVEIGVSYNEATWEQAIISFGEFLFSFVEPASRVRLLYLAQHDLISHFPKLENDISIPWIINSLRNRVYRNIWFGMAGCHTPLHRDPYDNLFVQAVGRKQFILINPQEIPESWAIQDRSGSILALSKRLTTLSVTFYSTILGGGDMLFIPQGWWHAVEGLSDNISLYATRCRSLIIQGKLEMIPCATGSKMWEFAVIMNSLISSTYQYQHHIWSPSICSGPMHQISTTLIAVAFHDTWSIPIYMAWYHGCISWRAERERPKSLNSGSELVGARLMVDPPTDEFFENLSEPGSDVFVKAKEGLILLGVEEEIARRFCDQIYAIYHRAVHIRDGEDKTTVAAVLGVDYSYLHLEPSQLSAALKHCQGYLAALLSDKCKGQVYGRNYYFVALLEASTDARMFYSESALSTPDIPGWLPPTALPRRSVLDDYPNDALEWSISIQCGNSPLSSSSEGFFQMNADTFCTIFNLYSKQEDLRTSALWRQLGFRDEEAIIKCDIVLLSRGAISALVALVLESAEPPEATPSNSLGPELLKGGDALECELFHLRSIIERDSEKHLKDFVASSHANRFTARKVWLGFSHACTILVPDALLCSFGMTSSHVRIAWREKVALCTIIMWISGLMLFLIMALPSLICPQQNIIGIEELQGHGASTIVYGVVYEVSSLIPKHQSNDAKSSHIIQLLGKDSSHLFPRPSKTGGHPLRAVKHHSTNTMDSTKERRIDHRLEIDHEATDLFHHSSEMYLILQAMPHSFLGIRPSVLKSGFGRASAYVSIRGNVYNVTRLFIESRNRLSSSAISALSPPWGVDKTDLFRYQGVEADLDIMLDYFVAKLDLRDSLNCILSQYLLIAVTGILAVVLLFKFLAALQLGQKRFPEALDRYVIILVPCYAENEELLRKTLDSIAMMKYQGEKMLLFVVADGIILNEGDHRSVPQILLEILDPSPSPEASIKEYEAISEDRSKSQNAASVYSGIYERAGRQIPYILVAKVGTLFEARNPGNRGKRDSQLILLRFLSRVIYKEPLNSLEQEIFEHMYIRIGVDPSEYEYVMMLDADTEVYPEALNRLISCCVHDVRIIGACGETRLANERHSWITMIQVYEYYISHHLSKAFESLFGTVTCLPGCFCIYRLKVRAQDGALIPLLLDKRLLDDYSETQVDTLHLKNLLSLGEDRYLTTLALKYFPKYRTKFTPDATCLTTAPERWAVLLSQRRRWINSTIHNLFELMLLPEMCGFCLFSMRFMVLIDLYATLVMPASVIYLAFLVVEALYSRTTPTTSLALLALAYGLQAVIFLLKRQWQHIGWMFLYIVSLPVFGVIIPLYAFWHFDEFSWGNTRTALVDNHQDGQDHFS